jgi:hypothetical protein
MTDFTDQERSVLTAIRNAVIEKGADYLYEPKGSNIERELDALGTSCFYLEYDEEHSPTGASCIVGHGLLDSGLSDTDSLMMVEGSSARLVVPDHGFDMVFTAALDLMQTYQDGGSPWGKSYNAGLKFLEDSDYDVSEFRLDTPAGV